MAPRALHRLTVASLLLAACSPPPPCEAPSTCWDARADAPFSPMDAPAEQPPRPDAAPGDAVDPRAFDAVSVRLDPPTASLVSVDGATPTQAFRAIATLRNGMERTLTAAWSLAANTVGTVDTAGLFTATGQAGGTVTVRADVAPDGLAPSTLTAEVTVTVQRTLTGAGIPAERVAAFANPAATDPARTAGVLYPLDGVLFPQNVFPADVQWLNGAAGDVFRVALRKPHATLTAYVLHTGAAFRNDWVVDAALWRAFAQSDGDTAGTLTVDRLLAGQTQPVAGAPVSVRFAQGSVLGTVYYWDIGAGRAVRIADGTATRDNFMPNPPVTPRSGEHCLGCHVVSRDGRYFAGRGNGSVGNGVGMTFDLTRDLTGSPAPTVFPLSTSSIDWLGASFSPDSTRLIVDQDGPLALVDPLTGRVLTPASGTLPSAGNTMPAWSPDGNSIAYVTNKTGDIAHLTAGDLAILPVTGRDAFGTPRMLHRATDLPGGATDSYPTWSPDSRWVAFAHGDTARSEVGRNALYLMPAAGGAPVRLDRACGGAGTTNNFVPNFSPFDVGGYFWLAFLSRRDYGNAQAGTRGTARQQVWVTAIRRTPSGSADPSEVAWWLPGQNTATANISAYWAPRACRRDGDDCSVATECCSGLCQPGSAGRTVCTPPPASMCRMRDQPCGGNGCCAGLVCTNNVCGDPPPG